MKPRTVEFDCGVDEARRLGAAIRAYAQAAYPPGGSECGQVARATLLDTAAACGEHRGGPLCLRRRQLAQIRAAIQWSLNENPPGQVESLRGLQQRLSAA